MYASSRWPSLGDADVELDAAQHKYQGSKRTKNHTLYWTVVIHIHMPAWSNHNLNRRPRGLFVGFTRRISDDSTKTFSPNDWSTMEVISIWSECKWVWLTQVLSSPKSSPVLLWWHRAAAALKNNFDAATRTWKVFRYGRLDRVIANIGRPEMDFLKILESNFFYLHFCASQIRAMWLVKKVT